MCKSGRCSFWGEGGQVWGPSRLHTWPLLFSLYINDLPEYIDQADISLYADDTAILVSSASYIDIVPSLRIELELIKQWLYLNELMLNVKKLSS